MQFGLCSVSSTFQRFIDKVIRGLEGVYAFIDDILIASKSTEEHFQHQFICTTIIVAYFLFKGDFV